MFGFLKRIGSAISHTATSVGKKVGAVANSAIAIGKKVAGTVGTIAKKVSTVSDSVSKGLAVAGGVAGALGLEPIAGALEAGAGLSKVVGEGAKGVGAVSKDVNRGLAQASGVVKTAGKVGSAVLSGDGASAMTQAGLLRKQGQDLKTSAQNTSRSAIERGKDVRQQFRSR